MGGTSEPKVHAEKEEIVKEVDGVMRLPSCLIYAALSCSLVADWCLAEPLATVALVEYDPADRQHRELFALLGFGTTGELCGASESDTV